jgi:predicted TIM-barrel fold metal-dependent hydrolase
MPYEGQLIDAHAHVFPDTATRQVFAQGYHRDYEEGGGLPESVRKYMVETGIARVNILCFLGAGASYSGRTRQYTYLNDPVQREQVEAIRVEIVEQILRYNEWGVCLAAEDSSFSCFIGLDPVLMDPATLMQELEDKVRRGAKGVKLVPLDYVATLDDRRHDAMWDFCQSSDLPVLHTPPRFCFYRGTGWKESFGHLDELAEVYRRFPRLRTCQAHLSLGTEAEYTAYLASQHPGVHADLSATLSKVGTNPGEITPERLVADIRMVGIDRVLFGSNLGTFPTVTAVEEVETFRSLPLAASEFKPVGADNFLNLVGA